MKKYIRSFIYICLFAILIGAFIYIGKKDFADNQPKYTDPERFAIEYNVTKENNFKYVYGSQLIDAIKNKKETGIVYLGFSSNDWSLKYVKYLMEVLNMHPVKNCYYYDMLKDRTKSTKYYRELENILNNYLYETDNGNTTINTPALFIIKDGNITFFDDETSVIRKNDTPDNYWNNERVENFKNKLLSALEGVD